MATATLDILVQLQDQASSALKGVSSNLQNMQKNLEPAAAASKAVAVGLAAIGAAAIGFGTVSVKAAAEAQTSMALFNQTLANTKGAGDTAKQTILDAAAAAVKLGFDDEDTALSIARLYQHTGDLTEAMKLNSIAMDLARDKNIDLSTAGNLVGLVLEGNARALKQYGISLKDTASPLEALGQLQDLVGGKAQAFANTFDGQMDVLKVDLQNLEEAVGEHLLPLLTKFLEEGVNPLVVHLGEWSENLQNLTSFLQKHQAILFAVAGAVVGALMPAFISLAITMLTVTIPAFIAAAIALAPWIIGGALIGGIVAGIVWLVQNWGEVKTKVAEFATAITKAWESVRLGFAAAIDAIVGKLNDIIAATENWLQQHELVAGAIVGVLSGLLAGAFLSFATFIGTTVIPAVIAFGTTLLAETIPSIVSFGITLLTETVPAIAGFVASLIASAGPAILSFAASVAADAVAAIVSFAVTIWTTVIPAIAAFTVALLANPVTALVALGLAIGLLVAYVVTHWDQIVAATSAMLGSISAAWTAAWTGIKSFFEGIWSAIGASFKAAINGIIGGINAFIQAFDRIKISVPKVHVPFVGDFGGFSISVPQIPEIPFLANGGIVTQPTLAVVGEAGPEAILPLNRLAGTGIGGGVTINFHGDVYSTREVAIDFANQIAKVLRYNQRI